MPVHSSLTGSELHEPKGADTASANQVYRSDGAGSGTWVDHDNIASPGLVYGDIITANGAGGSSYNQLVWKDLIGEIGDRSGGVAPTARAYRGGLYQYAFSAGNEAFLNFHIPHDYAVGTDIFLHVHWSHITAATTTSSPVFDFDISYSKGHNQDVFPAPVTPTITGSNGVAQYRHIIDEIQLSASTPSATQIDTDDLEVDGIIALNFTMTTLPGSVGVNDMFIHYIDIHYQADIIGTKNKAPNFYA